jgi:hypothetical protein
MPCLSLKGGDLRVDGAGTSASIGMGTSSLIYGRVMAEGMSMGKHEGMRVSINGAGGKTWHVTGTSCR